MRKLNGDTCKGFKKRNFLDVDQVSSSSFINRMLFDFDSDVNISCDDTRLNYNKNTY